MRTVSAARIFVSLLYFLNLTLSGKPGLCPVLGDFTLEICFKKCTDDFDCEGVRKCCKTSCNGFQCQIPDEKPGSCPSPENTNGPTCDPSVHCSSDNKCEGEQKCCPDRCNQSSCQNPVWSPQWKAKKNEELQNHLSFLETCKWTFLILRHHEIYYLLMCDLLYIAI